MTDRSGYASDTRLGSIEGEKDEKARKQRQLPMPWRVARLAAWMFAARL
jgi:hypothetical protein